MTKTNHNGSNARRVRKNCAAMIRFYREHRFPAHAAMDARHIALMQRHAGFRVTGR